MSSSLDETSMHLSQATACEDCGHLCYDQEEIDNHRASSSKCNSCSSLDDLDSEDFWNMTLDDLDNLSISSAPSRRRSDGMVGLVSKPLQQEQDAAALKKKKQLPRRNVSFGQVKVRVCERVLGDNPACASSGGPSLSLGWNYDTEEVLDLESWESQRVKKRRSYSELVLSPEKRERIAKKYGFTKKDIDENIQKMAKYHRRRERTLKELEKNSLVSLLAHGRSQIKSSSSNNVKISLSRFLKDHGGNKNARTNIAQSLRSV